MSALVSIDMICDTCGRRLPTTRTKVAGARGDAQRAGWRVSHIGDLTARHLFGAATITYRTEGEISTGVIERTIPIPDGRLRLLMHAPGNRAAQWDAMLSLDTPCEVLP